MLTETLVCAITVGRTTETISMSKNFTFAFIMLALVSVALPGNETGAIALAATSRQKTKKPATNYACPMHPEVTSRRPGRCAKCEMALRPAPARTSDAASTIPQPTPATNNETVPPLRIADVSVLDQTGKRLNFYTDLVKGKVVAINFVFTTCTNVCPPLTATFRRVQIELEKARTEAQLISISVDPTTDTPERLRDFAAKFKAGPGWSFVTGDKTEIDALLSSLGAAVSNKTDHTPLVLIGNESKGFWIRTYGLSSPNMIAGVIQDAASRK
jgi:cytochrome oxidase Cu insertion factor (SCO1/SenC/PrrC family)